jgi:hypothetical protein
VEHEWWQERNIDPLIIANRLWQRSRARYPIAGETEPARIAGGRNRSASERYPSE